MYKTIYHKGHKGTKETTMTTNPILDSISFDAEGYMSKPDEWNKEVAEALAAQEGIQLTPTHWKVLEFSRLSAKETGQSPMLRVITNGIGMSPKAVFDLFPKSPSKRIARIAGLKKPPECL
jgi:tRNA 2-thiouridine synthesizing protein E